MDELLALLPPAAMQPGFWLTGFALLLLLGLIGMFVRHWRRGRDSRSLRRIMKSLGEECLRDVVFPDGLDGFMFADYLLLCRGRVLLINIIDRGGVILGMDGADAWTAIENRRSESFANPVLRLEQVARQMRHDLAFDGIEPLSIFLSHAAFPKGIPAGAVPLHGLKAHLGSLPLADDAGLPARACWQRLEQIVARARRELARQG